MTQSLDDILLEFITKEYERKVFYQTSDGVVQKGMHTSLTSLHHLKGGTDEEKWAALSRLCLAGKIRRTGSHRHKTYAPVEAA